MAVEDVVSRLGTVAPERLAYAAKLIEETPLRLAQAASEPFAARALVYAILLDCREDVRRRQLAVLEARLEPPTYREVLALVPLVAKLGDEARLPLVDRAAPALTELSPRQYADFREVVARLIQADGVINLLEYTIQAMLFRTLDLHFGRVKPPRVHYYGIRGVLTPAVTVLSTLAYAGHPHDDEAARRAFALGAKELACDAAILSKADCTLERFDAALRELTKAAPKVKRPVVAACAACIAADAATTLREAELLRAVAATLGCPMPPGA